jgi:hypothetical protein
VAVAAAGAGAGAGAVKKLRHLAGFQ